MTNRDRSPHDRYSTPRHPRQVEPTAPSWWKQIPTGRLVAIAVAIVAGIGIVADFCYMMAVDGDMNSNPGGFGWLIFASAALIGALIVLKPSGQ